MHSYVHHQTLCKYGEDVVGDNVKFTAGRDAVFTVMSDGLGSGVKANIFSTLTVEIILTMATANMPLAEIVRTISRTLPVCRERHIAYSTFAVCKVGRGGRVELILYDTPEPVIIASGALLRPEYEAIDVMGRTIRRADLQLAMGDAVFLLSDGVPFAGLGTTHNFGWGWDNIAAFIIEQQSAHGLVGRTVRELAGKVMNLYGGMPGDDATMVGCEVRDIRRLTVLTGPPADLDDDERIVRAFLNSPGEKVVCGGTTANIITRLTGWEGEVDLATGRPDIPPMGSMDGVAFVTEGVLTISKAIELIKAAELDPERLPDDHNGAVCLAEALLRSDHIQFMVGLKVDPLYQNPLLPVSVSLRRYLIDELETQLRQAGKTVDVLYH